METRRFAQQNISLLGLGAMRLPLQEDSKTAIDEIKAGEMLDYALGHGINYIDTAYMYHGGESESYLGRALKAYDRSSYQLATKLPVWMAKDTVDLEKIFQEQLNRLQTEYFDFYLCHSLNQKNLDLARKYKAYEFMFRMKEEGRIRHLGFSFHDNPALLDEICKRYNWDFAQIQLNYIDWDFQKAKNQYEILEYYGLPCIVMEPVRGGALADLCPEANSVLQAASPSRSIASWALRFAAQLPNVLTVLSGMSNIEQLQDNINTMTDFEPLSPQEEETLSKALEIYRRTKLIPCTGCRYCMDCKQGVDIPKMFALHNEYRLGTSGDIYLEHYEATKRSQRESNCTECGRCSEHCPQNIDIPTELRKTGEVISELYKNR
ncbi:MAG: aldo/keto reductase [Bacillota bacterium]|nr:aldo/keto reductase [Bacillota bacterium]